MGLRRLPAQGWQITMGADGTVTVYNLALVEAEHRARHGRELASDWWYVANGNCVVTLDGKRWLLDYCETEVQTGTECEGWFGTSEFPWGDPSHLAAQQRVLETLAVVGPADETEVWT